MTELATINAKIDKLNAKLKADPIVVVSEWPEHATKPFAVAPYERTVTDIIASLDIALNRLRWANSVSEEVEKRAPHRTIRARKIQLAILERLA